MGYRLNQMSPVSDIGLDCARPAKGLAAVGWAFSDTAIQAETSMRGNIRSGAVRRSLFALICVSLIATGCSKSDKEPDDGSLNTSKLPRVTGSKEIFASPGVTNFTSPVSVADTADTLDTALAAAVWQKYIAPNTAYSQDPAQRSLSLKKGTQALHVFITVAPAQNNTTGVQYSVRPLKTDLPFTKDASNIEYSPERPLLTLVTGEPVDKTLEFYRKELAARGWSLWSEKTNGKATADAPSGDVRANGGSAEYVNDKEPAVTLVVTLQKAEAGKYKVELKEWPIGILETMHRAYVNSDNHGTLLVEVGKLPRLEGATEQADRTTNDRLVYAVPRPLADTRVATIQMLNAAGWKPYVMPLEETHWTSIAFKKAGQGLSVSFTIQVGKNERTSEVTTVYYSPARLTFALAAPDDATELVFDQNRPYLNLVSAGTLDATRDFYNKQLLASGWKVLSASDATAKWPNAKLETSAAYYDRGNNRPIMLSMQRRDDKTNVEIKVAPFALPQELEAGEEIYGVPRPKLANSAGGTSGSNEREMHAYLAADVTPVLAFYRRELAARNWTEETQGAVINPDDVTLNFSSADKGTAVLKLGHKYDLTTVSFVQKLPKVAERSQPAIRNEPSGNDSIDAMLRQAQQMVRDATADAMKAPKPPQASNDPVETLRPRAGNDAPVPLPETAEDVELANGRLEFTAASNVKAVAELYRATMKQQGWQPQSSVINNANMVVLNFSKAGKSVSFTIMKMGNKTNVSADGSALKGATAKADAPADKTPAADTASQPATEDDLIAEESGGLPVPKRHTLAEGTKTQL